MFVSNKCPKNFLEKEIKATTAFVVFFTKGTLTFPGVTEMEHWAKMGYKNFT